MAGISGEAESTSSVKKEPLRQNTNNIGAFPMQLAISQLQATLSDIYETTVSGMAAIETPTDYYTQVERCREIWPVYGSVAKYGDPVVSTIMDMMVAVTVAFGSENMIPGIPYDADQKKVLDHWCGQINKGNPELTPGLDFMRKQLHKMRFCDGGVVVAWTPPEPLETPDGIKYRAPKNIACLPRTQFSMKSSKEFGGFKLQYKTDLQDDTSGLGTEEVGADEKAGELQNFLTSDRYQVVDRGRIESTQKYPVPFLAARNLTSICARIRAMQRGDYQTVLRIINALLLVTRGSDQWVKEFGWNPTAQDFSAMQDALTADGHKQANVIAGDYTYDAKWVVPPLGELMGRDKYDHDDVERLAGLGIVEIQGTGQRRSVMFNPKPLIMEVADAMHEDRRFIEGRLFEILWEENQDIFANIPHANFYQKPMTLFLEEAEKQILLELHKMGMPWGPVLETVVGNGVDIDAVVEQRKYEDLSGYTKTLEVRNSFAQVAVKPEEGKGTDNDEDEEEDDGLEAAQKPLLLDMYDGLREQVKENAGIVADEKEESKQRTIKYLVLAAMAAFAANLKDRVRTYYGEQFADSAYALQQLNPYIDNLSAKLDTFGEDLLQGTTGLNAAIAADDMNAAIDRAFDASTYRLGLYETEPFRVAKASADAAKATLQGNTYAVRLASFSPTTCEECIARHGDILPVSAIFKGDWDHPNGQCTFEFYVDKAAAEEAVKDIMNIDEINAVIAAMDEIDI